MTSGKDENPQIHSLSEGLGIDYDAAKRITDELGDQNHVSLWDRFIEQIVERVPGTGRLVNGDPITNDWVVAVAKAEDSPKGTVLLRHGPFSIQCQAPLDTAPTEPFLASIRYGAPLGNVSVTDLNAYAHPWIRDESHPSITWELRVDPQDTQELVEAVVTFINAALPDGPRPSDHGL